MFDLRPAFSNFLFLSILFSAACKSEPEKTVIPVPPQATKEFVNLAAGYQSKNLCSGVYVSKRTKDDVEAHDFEMFKLFNNSYTIDVPNKEVTVRVQTTQYDESQSALYREGMGCTLLGKIGADSLKRQEKITLYTKVPNQQKYWPLGDKAYDKTIPGFDVSKVKVLVEKSFSNPARRSLVVVYDGKLVAEKYATGFTKETKFPGWSMTKFLENILLGILHKQGNLNVHNKSGIKEWENDDRKNITIDQLGRMTSGLAWDEDYTKESDITRMLYEQDDMCAFAINKPQKKPENTVYNYSSGSAMILSKIIRNKFSSLKEYLEFPQKTLCKDLNIELVLEPDGAQNLVMASYGWMTTRDWTKLGLLFYNNGNYNGKQVLLKDWVDYSKSPTMVSPNPDYGFLFDLNLNREKYTKAPIDMYYIAGYSGQRTFVIPSKKLIISQTALMPDDVADSELNLLIDEVIKCIN